MIQPFEHPGIVTLFGKLRECLFRESGRGALLIATTYVEEYLTKLIENVVPKTISQNHKDRIFKYPGHLSSFASKIELAYVFRLITKDIYDCLNALRKLRNNAAHKIDNFELHELNKELKAVYNLGDGIPTFTKEMSFKLLLHEKFSIIQDHYKDSNFSEEELNIKAKEILTEEKFLKAFEKQIPFWEMIVGISLLCWIMIYEAEQIASLTKDMNTWGGLNKSRK